MNVTTDSFTLDCTGDVVVGDTILFTEAVWAAYKPQGRFRRKSKPQPLGERTIIAEVVNDSYGAAKQQHTFTLLVLESEGYEPLQPQTKTTRKGRNIYRNGVKRLHWEDEATRRMACDEKHVRGNNARGMRAARRSLEETKGW
jgi:hypothetical protein